MLALGKSALNTLYHEIWDEACYYDGHGHIELTSYGEWLCGLRRTPLAGGVLPLGGFRLNRPRSRSTASIYLQHAPTPARATYPVLTTETPQKGDEHHGYRQHRQAD